MQPPSGSAVRFMALLSVSSAGQKIRCGDALTKAVGPKVVNAIYQTIPAQNRVSGSAANTLTRLDTAGDADNSKLELRASIFPKADYADIAITSGKPKRENMTPTKMNQTITRIQTRNTRI